MLNLKDVWRSISGMSGEEFFRDILTTATPTLHAICWALSKYEVHFGDATVTTSYCTSNRFFGECDDNDHKNNDINQVYQTRIRERFG